VSVCHGDLTREHSDDLVSSTRVELAPRELASADSPSRSNKSIAAIDGGRRSVAAVTLRGADGAVPSNEREQYAWGFVRGLLSGLFFGASIACKQPGVLDFAAAFVVLGVATLRAPRENRRGHLSLGLGLALGGALPMTLFAAYYAAKGAYADFVYYALTYNTKVYVPEVPVGERWSRMADPFTLAWAHVPEVLVFGGIAACLGLLALRPRSTAARHAPLLPWVFLGWTAAGIVSTGLSGRAFSHYSAQVAPGLCLACGWTAARLFAVARAPKRSILLRVCAALALLAAAFGLVRDSVQRIRKLTSDDPFMIEIGRLVAAQTGKSDRIFVWGYSPNLYPFAHRLPASRFLYTNFLTGLIPWTNLDPFIDTSYAVTPRAWAQLADDFKRHPPAVIVDTGGLQGYLKYPFHDQPLLHQLVERDFAEVAAGRSLSNGFHVYRRLEPPSTTALASSIPLNARVQIRGLNNTHYGRAPQLLVEAPAGARRIELYADSHAIAAVSSPLGQEVQVAFNVDHLRAGANAIRAVVTSPTGRSVSAAFDFAEYAGKLAAAPLTGPLLQIESQHFPPILAYHPFGDITRSPLHPNTWRLDAPVRLEYQCPENLSRVSFLHGPYPETRGKSDGYDLLVSLEDEAGQSLLLHQHRLLPRTVGADQRPQAVTLDLPPHRASRLIFRFLPGKNEEPDFDWIYFGQLTGICAGPILLMGDRPVLPLSGVSSDHQRMEQHENGTWIAHAPSRLEWVRPAELSALTIVYGMEDGSYTAPEGHSDGVDFALELIEADGTRHSLFNRALTPFNHPEHRGAQKARVEIPAKIAGKLVLTVGPGPRDDQSWDWAYIGKITCEGPGPNIVINEERELMPISSRTVDATGAPSKYDGENRWGAHADAELVYERPADLMRVTFQYGLAESAARDENGKRRSDGVDAVVEFTPSGGPSRELFRRHLDPFANPEDAGTQTSTIELPHYVAGRLIFRLTPGPSGNNAYDWGYWGLFHGEVVK